VVFDTTNYNSVMGTPTGAAVPTGSSVSPPAAASPNAGAVGASENTNPKAAVTPSAPGTAAAAPANWDMQTAMAKGKQVYAQNCAACHMPDGTGNTEIGAPAFHTSAIANGPVAAHIQRVLKGKGAMPAWGSMLNDMDIAAVITFERNSFGNHKGDVVKPSDVAAAR
jgi:mono/diheme cytochrome c family protein